MDWILGQVGAAGAGNRVERQGVQMRCDTDAERREREGGRRDKGRSTDRAGRDERSVSAQSHVGGRMGPGVGAGASVKGERARGRGEACGFVSCCGFVCCGIAEMRIVRIVMVIMTRKTHAWERQRLTQLLLKEDDQPDPRAPGRKPSAVRDATARARARASAKPSPRA